MSKSGQRPTDAELEILQVLWEIGPCTVRDVHSQLSNTRDMGYTTVLKLMQIMAEKNLVHRDESQRSHIYRAKHKREQTQKQLLLDLASRAFGGSANRLVMQALQTQKISHEEIDEIRTLLDSIAEVEERKPDAKKRGSRQT